MGELFLQLLEYFAGVVTGAIPYFWEKWMQRPRLDITVISPFDGGLEQFEGGPFINAEVELKGKPRFLVDRVLLEIQGWEGDRQIINEEWIRESLSNRSDSRIKLPFDLRRGEIERINLTVDLSWVNSNSPKGYERGRQARILMYDKNIKAPSKSGYFVLP